MNLKPGDVALVKADAWKGKRKIKDRWEEETWEVVHQIAADIPSYEVMNQHGWSQVLHQNQHVCKAEGWHLHLLMLADSEPKEECYHSLNWVTAGKAKQKGEWNG